MERLSLVIDPGGTPNRPGLNLRVFPSGDKPLKVTSQEWNVERTANKSIILGSLPAVYDFECQVSLKTHDYSRLRGLVDLLSSEASQYRSPEVVIYNLAEPFTEVSLERTRYRVPGTTNVWNEVLSGGYIRRVYWVALQGVLQLETDGQQGDIWECQLTFTEGTKLTRSMEP